MNFQQHYFIACNIYSKTKDLPNKTAQNIPQHLQAAVHFSDILLQEQRPSEQAVFVQYTLQPVQSNLEQRVFCSSLA